METKLMAMILGVALVLATAATVYTQSALTASALIGGGHPGVGEFHNAFGLDTSCGTPAFANDPHCHR